MYSEPQSVAVMSTSSGSNEMTVPYGERDIDQAIEWLQAKKARAQESQEVIGVQEQFDCHPLDGAYAFAHVLAEKFGWTALVPTPGFFGERPPRMINVTTANGKLVTVPWGRMNIPSLQGTLEPSAIVHHDMVAFLIHGTIKRAHLDKVQEIFAAVRDYVKQHSIYRGHAIKLEFPDTIEDVEDDFNPVIEHAPKFLDLSWVSDDKIVLAKSVADKIERDIIRPLQFTDRCREEGIPLKRGVLLEGPPGVGKTLTAMLMGKKAVEQGWTFVYTDSPAQLEMTIEFALQNQPSLVFCEDVDRVDREGQRNNAMNYLLNVIDGIEAKGTELLVVLTTNHLENITAAMRRPGRLDSIISLRTLDVPAVVKLLRLFMGDKIDPMTTDLELTKVAQLLTRESPAVINEVVQRAKLSAITISPLMIGANDLLVAIEDMRDHMELLRTGPGFGTTAARNAPSLGLSKSEDW